MRAKVVKLNFGGEEKEFKFTMPSLKDKREGKKVYNRVFRESVSSGAMVREKLRDVLRDQNLWDDNKQKEYAELMQRVAEIEFTILTGLDFTSKKKVHLKHARKLAIELRNEVRPKLSQLLSIGADLDTKTADAQAENEEFNYYVASCTVYNDVSRRVFSSYEDYLNRADEKDVERLANAYADFYHNLDSLDIDDRLPEVQFLKDWKFIDKDGRFIDSEGNYIDKEGNPVDNKEDSTFEIPKKAVFLDDNDTEVSLPEESENEESLVSTSDKA